MDSPQCFPGELGGSSPMETLPGFDGWCRAQAKAWTHGELHDWRSVQHWALCEAVVQLQLVFKAAIDSCEPSLGQQECNAEKMIFSGVQKLPCPPTHSVTPLGDCHHVTCRAACPPSLWDTQKSLQDALSTSPRNQGCQEHFGEERLLVAAALVSLLECGKPQLNS